MMNWYLVILDHDDGPIEVVTSADSTESAFDRVCAEQHVPGCAVLSVRYVGSV